MKKPKKYYMSIYGKIFVGKCVSTELVKVSNFLNDIIEDSYVLYSVVYNQNLIDDFINSLNFILKRFDVYINKFSKNNLEENEDWFNIITQDIIALYSSIETVQDKFSPEKINMAKIPYYNSIYNDLTVILHNLSEILYYYFRIEDFAEDDRTKFNPETQMGFSLLDNYNGDIDVIPRHAGFYDVNKKSIIKKEIVSIRRAKYINKNIDNL